MKTLFLILTGTVVSMNSWASVVTYTVPATDSQMSEVNQFKLNVSCKRSADGGLRLKYTLPAELTGVPVSIKVEQSVIDPTVYSGKHADMKCQDDGCSVTYKNLPENSAALSSHLQDISSSPEDYHARYQVAMASHGDPGGTFNENPSEYCPQ